MLESSQPEVRSPLRVTRRRRGWRFVRDILIIFLIALLASVLIKTFLVRSFYVPSASMENTLQLQDRVLVDELVPGVIGVQRGDVIVFTDPGGWLLDQPTTSATGGNPVGDVVGWLLTAVGLSAQDSNDHLIKRVIGLPGDKVVCCNALGQTSVNDIPLSEPYTKNPLDSTQIVPFSVTVPNGSVWVEGDNRNDSEDSRYHTQLASGGFVPMSDIVGRAFVITWPMNRWSVLDDYGTTFHAVEPAGQ